MLKSHSIRILLSLFFCLSWTAGASAADPIAGTDYVEIANPTRYRAAQGKIEVAEVFGYTCPHCAHFETQINRWRMSLPDDVNFVVVPAPFGSIWNRYARAYFTAESLRVLDKSHDAVFEAIHVQRNLPRNATEREIAEFYAAYGVDPQRFVQVMSSPQINDQLQHAEDFIRNARIEGTPALIINGKYLISGHSFTDTLHIADSLIAKERAAQR